MRRTCGPHARIQPEGSKLETNSAQRQVRADLQLGKSMNPSIFCTFNRLGGLQRGALGRATRLFPVDRMELQNLRKSLPQSRLTLLWYLRAVEGRDLTPEGMRYRPRLRIYLTITASPPPCFSS